jgi:hypothetical protein
VTLNPKVQGSTPCASTTIFLGYIDIGRAVSPILPRAVLRYGSRLLLRQGVWSRVEV